MENPSPPEDHPLPEAAAVALKDIALASGLSISSVSRALANRPEIGEATRERVKALALEMGYNPNPMGAGLAQFRKTSATRPLHSAMAWVNLWPKPEELRSYHQFELYWQGALRSAAKHGYRLEEFRVNGELTPRRLQTVLQARGIHGILMPPVTVRADWSGFDWGKFSAVSFTRRMEGFGPLHVVTSAQSANAALCFAEVIGKGYERIGYVGVKGQGWTYAGGFLEAQAIRFPEKLRLPPLFFEHSDHQDAKLFLTWLRKWKPDAIITELSTVSDLLKQAGCRVPEDIGVAALNVNDMPFDAGIDQNAEEIGRIAVLAVISLLNDNSCGIPAIQREVIIKGRWVDGASLPPRG